ncbi:MAG: acyl-CoA thioesterase [Cyclobacteriaceae bacterium]|nr:acyl-CoA thioesterase [Cyclobacteriaceae bacterium]
MYSKETEVRVRYSETDQMGYVYYGNYAAYYEVGRVEALRSLGMSYRSLEESGIMMPVLESNSRFIKPAKYDDLIRMQINIPSLPTSRITFEYKLFLGDVLIHEGNTTLAFVNMETGRPVRAPGKMIDLLKPFYEVK